MILNRSIQKNVLRAMAKAYPEPIDTEAMYFAAYEIEFAPSVDFDMQQDKAFWDLVYNMYYLGEHGLVKIKWTASHCPIQGGINAAGLDLLEDDGGLSAILNTVTVKFDMNNVRELVESGLLKANVPEEKQGALKKAIREAPGTMLQTVVTKMVEKGMSDPVGTARAVAGLFGITW